MGHLTYSAQFCVFLILTNIFAGFFCPGFSVIPSYVSSGSHAALCFLSRAAFQLEGRHKNWKRWDRLCLKDERLSCSEVVLQVYLLGVCSPNARS